ncbi:MAG: hypothetical protein OEZ22_08770 [Spirochaetia bacterium]|nr:hypothetical protein [Spirochaetia bacterium]
MKKLQQQIHYFFPYLLYFLIPVFYYFIASAAETNFVFLNYIFYISCIFLCAILLLRYYYDFITDNRKILFLFIFCSAMFLFKPPLLSGDIHRYVWEGHVQNLGYNPYSIAPDNTIFNNETLNKEVNHPRMTAIYPPLAQIIFRFFSLINPSLYLFKLFFLLVSLYFVFFLSRKKEFFKDAYLLAALFPFFIIETSSSGHFDIIGILFLTLAVFYLYQNDGSKSGLFLVFSVLTKIVPVIFLPLFFVNLKKKQKLYFTAAFTSGFLLYIPYINAGIRLFDSFSTYSKDWVFRGYFYTMMKFLGFESFYARIFLVFMFLCIYIIIFFKIKNISENIFLTWLSLFLLSPVAYPWYLLWLIPFCGKKYFYAAAFFMLASFFTYEVLDKWFCCKNWEENFWLVVLSYSAATAVSCSIAFSTNWFKEIPKS